MADSENTENQSSVDPPSSTDDKKKDAQPNATNNPTDMDSPKTEVLPQTEQNVANVTAESTPISDTPNGNAQSTPQADQPPAEETDDVLDDDIEYMSPMEDPLEKAAKFLAKHDIFGLLQNITAGIAYKRPKEPLQFMIEEIEKLQEEDRRRQGVITRTSSAKSTADTPKAAS